MLVTIKLVVTAFVFYTPCDNAAQKPARLLHDPYLSGMFDNTVCFPCP